MLNIHSPSVNHARVIRHAVLNNLPIPERSRATLEARGVDVGELEHRIRHNMGLLQ